MPNTNSVAVNRDIENYIAEYQEEFLVSMLGECLGNKVHCYLVCLDEEGGRPRKPCFEDLTSRLQESFADYVFFQILGHSNTMATTSGLVRVKNANTDVAPIGRQVLVWNEMVKRNKRFAQWCESDECPYHVEMQADMLTPVNTLNL